MTPTPIPPISTPVNLDFFFWWSVVSTIIGIILLCFSVHEKVTASSEKQRKKDQVKIWMQDANGISLALLRIVQDNLGKRYSSTNDMANAVWGLQASAFSLYQSLYEERCVTEEEYKQLQQELKEQVKKQQEELQKQQRVSQPLIGTDTVKLSVKKENSNSAS